MKPFTMKELCRLWGLFYVLCIDARERGDDNLWAFFDNERRAVMDRRVKLLPKMYERPTEKRGFSFRWFL